MTTITLPWPDPVLSPNSPRRHWRAKSAARIAARNTAYCLALEARNGADLSGALTARWTFCPPNGKRRDLDNLHSSVKSACDGACAALGIDDSQIKRVVLEWGDVTPGGEVRLRLERTA